MTTSDESRLPFKLLNQDNFSEWKAGMESALKEKKMWRQVCDVRGAADDDDNQAASGFITRRIEYQQRAHVPDGVNAHGVWKALCAAHEKQGPQAEVRYLLMMKHAHYVDGTKMEDHLSKMREIFARLHAIGSSQLSEQSQASWILTTLPPSWDTVSTVLASSPAPLAVASVSHALLEEQLRRANAAQSAQRTESAAALLVSASNSTQSKVPRKKCTWCLNLNHTEDECRGKASGKPRRLPYSNAAGNAGAGAHAVGPTSNFVFTASQAPVSVDGWVIDSGASDHYCSHRAMFTSLSPADNTISVGDGRTLSVTGTGPVRLSTLVPGKANVSITLTGVSYVPSMTVNLLSISRLAAAGLKVTFSGTQCIIRKGKNVIGVGDQLAVSRLWKLRTLSTSPSAPSGPAASPSTTTALLAAGEESPLPSAQLWHARMGHLHHTAVARLLRERMTTDGPAAPLTSAPAGAPHCSACVMGKQHRAPVPRTTGKRAERVLYRIHADVGGPFSTESETGARYLLLLVDDHSRYKWLRPTTTKDEAFGLIQQYVAAAECMHPGQRVSVLHTDNGGEFVSNEFDAWLRQRGIRRELTVPYTPHQNGVAERAMRTIVEMARAMLFAARLPKSFWALAVAAAVYVRNRSPTATLDHCTPYEAWYGRKPAIAHMRVFGCLAYAHVHASKREKLDPKAQPCTFVGYSPTSTGYLLWDGHKVITSNDVYFVEHELGPCAGEAGEAQGALAPVDDIDDSSSHSDANVIPPPVQPNAAPPAMQPSAPPLPPLLGRAERSAQRRQHAAQRRQLKASLPPELAGLTDHLQAGPKDVAPSVVADTAPSSVAHFALVVHAGLATTVNDSAAADPLTYREAMASAQRAQWRGATDSEMQSLKRAGTYSLVLLPVGRSVLGCKWVFKAKYGADGQIVKYKARVVAKGFLQRFGVDYDETYAPVARYPSIRAVLALAAHHGWELHQMDVKSAYLNGDLDEEIYMAQPEGYDSAETSHLVCKLHKSLYGLRQAARTWHLKMDDALREERFTALAADQCVYTRVQDGHVIVIALYVDDLLLASDDLTTLTELKRKLAARFEMEDMGEAGFILGIDIRRDRAARTISIGQAAYVTAVLQRHGMADCKPAVAPMSRDAAGELVKSPDDLVVAEATTREYQAIIGAVMFAMLCTRPDIAFAVTRLAQYASKPSPAHMVALKHLMRYLRGTINQRITYTGSGSVTGQPALVGYCDADWGQRLDDRRSVTGYVFLLAGGAISWQSKKQKTVALSTVEAEYMATTQATKEAIWWRSYLAGLGHDVSGATVLLSDSQGSIALAKNPDHHARTKHIDVQYHFIRQHVALHTIDLQYVGTADMAADILTKSLERVAHDKGRKLLGMLA